ncbi:MAG: hypothetical protein AAF572_28125 [Cyanobacteria bacterium P01_B01_bin.77]
MTTYSDPEYPSPSGDWIDLTTDEGRQQAMAAETLISSDVIAGVPGRPGWMKTWPQLSAYDHYMQVRSLVLRGFAALIREANLGVGQDAAISCGKQLVFERMMSASANVQEQVLALIDWTMIGPKTELTPQRMGALKAVFREVMTEADWSEISNAATRQIQQQVMTLTDTDTKVA